MQKVIPLKQNNLLHLPGKLSRVGLDLPDDLSRPDWKAIGKTLHEVDTGLMWWLGDWLRFGQVREWGEKYDEAVELGFQYQKAADAVWVAGKFQFSCRHEKLSWSHHWEVARLPPNDADRFLDQAEAHGWSTKDLRRQVSDFKRGVTRKQQQFEAEQLGLANVIYADPPWQYSNSGFLGSAEEHYPTMPTDDICAMTIGDAVAEDAALFLWVTNPLLDDGKRVMAAWGFDYKTNFAWVKEEALYGKLGFYNYSRHELMLLGIRGSFLPEVENELPQSVIEAATTDHSRKPPCVYELIEQMYPSSIKTSLEIFCRGAGRAGWMRPFGNEVVRDAAE